MRGEVFVLAGESYRLMPLGAATALLSYGLFFGKEIQLFKGVTPSKSAIVKMYVE